VPFYLEERESKAPTTNRLFRQFDDVRRHQLLGPDNAVLKRFCDPLSEVQLLALRLLRMPPESYWEAPARMRAASQSSAPA
jgi:hypothetical protein